MAAATPAPSNPPSDSTPPPNPANTTDTHNDPSTTDQLIIEYLRSRGHRNAERALREALNLPSTDGNDSNDADTDNSAEATNVQTTVSDAELRKHLVPFFQRTDRPAGENALTDAALTLQSLQSSAVTSPTVSALLGNIAPGGADEIISLDPTDKHEGFRDLEAWVDGSLDMYRVCYHLCPFANRK